MMMDGDERVVAAAQHLVRSLGTDENMTEDMIRILSTFDDRLSGMNDRFRQPRQTGVLPPPNRRNGARITESPREILDRNEGLIRQWEASVHPDSMIWDDHLDEAKDFLHAIDEVQSTLGSQSLSRPDKERAQDLLQVAMARLELEFRHILLDHTDSPDSNVSYFDRDPTDASSYSSSGEGEDTDDGDCELVPVAQPVTDLDHPIDLLPMNRVLDLRSIAQRLVAGGCGRECCSTYISIRKPVLEESLYRLGAEKLSFEDVQKMAWENVELKVRKWSQVFKICIKIVYASERRLCNLVFTQLSPWRESTFFELTKGSVVTLLNFAEAFAISKRSPEKLFKILDMFEALSALIPDVESIFSDDTCANIRAEVTGVLMRLGEAARGTIAEFENAIRRDVSKTPVQGGAVHPLTRYVMNYMRFLFDYQDTLKQILGNRRDRIGLMGADGVRENYRDAGNENLPPLAMQMICLTVLLEDNLDTKSRLYKDVAQTYLFLMNNVQYMLAKVQQSEIASLIGNDWQRKHMAQVRQYATSYVRAAWKKVVACLRDEGLAGGGSVMRMAVKNRFQTFNTSFEEACRTQSTWVVQDSDLRENLRISVADKLVPAYRSFLGRYQSYLENERHPEKFIKYTVEGLENCLLELFEGTPNTAPAARSFSGN